MREGRNLTRDFQIDSKQHELLGMDLGEGVDRRFLIIGAALSAVWLGLMLLIFGAPTPQLFLFYAGPPILLTVFGARPHPDQPRRRNLTQWVLKLRQILGGSKPIIRAGAHRPTWQERMPLNQRITWAEIQQKIARTPAPRRTDVDPFDWVDRPVGPVEKLNRRPIRLVGDDHLDAAIAKYQKRKKTVQ